MVIDFLSVLNESNSIKNESTGEITIKSPVLQINDKYQINSSCKITSNCDTVIKSDFFEITASSVSFSNIAFQTSLLIQDSNNITLTNCSIKNAKQSYGAITIFNSKDVLLNHVTVTDTIDIPGMFIYKNSSVAADHLLIHNITKSFIAINSGSFISIKDSTFHHTKRNAIYMADHSSIEIFNSSFYDIAYPGFFFENSQCVIKNNTFQNISENAIILHSSKDFLIDQNIFNQIGDSAIQISDESIGTVSTNTIYGIKGNGIYCYNSNIQVKNNEIYDLTYPAIAVATKSTASLFENKIRDIKCSGICVRHAKDVKIESTQIENIEESGISISDTENCIVENNLITNCKIASIEAYNGSKVYVKSNIINHIENQAFLIFTSGFMKAEKNDIKDVKCEMVKLSYKGGGEFLNNNVSGCLKQCDCQTSSSYFFSGNGTFKSVTNDHSRLSNDNLILFDNSFIDGEVMCMKCHVKKRNCFLLNCGHKAFCQECAEIALKNNEHCPLCRFQIVNVSDGFGSSFDDTCIICCENRPDCIILPCGHIGVCTTCLENWINANQSCPICRARPCIYKQIVHDI